jgi:hypothetical protein
MKYEVKVKVIETHYLTIDADSKEDAEKQAGTYGTDSADAHTTDVEIISTVEAEK